MRGRHNQNDSTVGAQRQKGRAMAKKKNKIVSGNLNIGKLGYRMPTVRSIIGKRAAAMGFSVYKIAKLSGVSNQTLHNFLDGTHHMRSDKLERVMRVLDLEIRPKQ